MLCKCVQYEGFVSLSLSHSLFMCEKGAERKQGGEGRRGSSWEERAILCLTACISLGVSTTHNTCMYTMNQAAGA